MSFKRISDGLLAELKNLGNISIYKKGALIFSEGENADLLPIVVSGKVKMLHFLEAGKEVIIDIFEKGEAFAVPPVFDGRKYPASAITMEETRLLLIGRGPFIELLRRSPDFSFYIIGWMCGMLREKTATIQYLATASPDARVAHVLLRLSEKEHTDSAVRITLLRRDIAEMVGLTTETTIRVIRKLAGRGLITITHGKIFVENPDRLREFLAYRA